MVAEPQAGASNTQHHATDVRYSNWTPHAAESLWKWLNDNPLLYWLTVAYLTEKSENWPALEPMGSNMQLSAHCTSPASEPICSSRHFRSNRALTVKLAGRLCPNRLMTAVIPAQ